MRRNVACLALLGCALAVAPLARSAPKEGDGPSAVQVVVRGKTKLVDALEAAARPAWADGKARPVLFVVDVTPPTQGSKAKIVEALTALDARAEGVPEWSLAALGAKPAKPVDSAGALGSRLDDVLAKETDVVSTLTSLRKTLKGWRSKGGVVVYLADWHFEDDVDLEGFIKDLEKKGRTISVVGTEAAFGRAWNDGFRDLDERLEDTRKGFRLHDYWEHVGRDPFGNKDAKAPWHGGDSAYPIAPYRWDWTLWDTAFSQSDWTLADLDEELGASGDEFFGGSAWRRLIDLQVELESVQRRLDEAVPGSAEAKHLEERKKALKAEIAEAETQREKEEEEAREDEGWDLEDPLLRDLRKQLTDVQAKQDALFEKLMATDDEEETNRLREEHETLSKEASRIEDAISKREEEIDAEREAEREKEAEPEIEDPGDEPPLDPEELKRRLPGKSSEPEEEPPSWVDPTMDEYREFPLPSTFGPYGLMRAAGVTGGSYVLWSWNPGGRKNVVLEYTRCNLFPPDLRSRKAIRADLKKNPWAASLVRAWWTILEARTDVLQHTPPLHDNLRSPAVMVRVESHGSLSPIWENPSEQKIYEKGAWASIEALDRALEILDEGIEKGGEPKTPVKQRYHAEALRFRHVVRVVRFELAESIQASKLIDKRSWRNSNRHGVVGHTWVGEGRNPERAKPRAGIVPFDPEAAAPLLAERKALLARFRGTPFGEELALNEIETSRTSDWERTDKGPGTGRSPTESVDRPKPTPKPPGAGSGGGGPTTGGG